MKWHFRQPVNLEQNFRKQNLLLANQILLVLCIFCKPILAIKRWFRFNFTKNLQGRHFLVGGPKKFKLLPDISFDRGFQKIVFVKFTTVFMCLLLSSPRRYSVI